MSSAVEEQQITGLVKEGDGWKVRKVSCRPELICSRQLTPVTDSDAKVVPLEMFRLSDIPATMRKKGWNVAARVQEKWFSNPPVAMDDDQKRGVKPYDPRLVDTNTVSLEWVLSFPRARSKYNELVKSVFDQQLRLAILKMVGTTGLIDGKPHSFSPARTDIQSYHRQWQFQRAPIDVDQSEKAEAFAFGIDDLFATFGGFNLNAAVDQIEVKPLQDGGILVSIQKIAIYARDTYDFIEPSQYLGHWNKDDMTTVPLHHAADAADYPVIPVGNPKSIFFCVRNRHYQQWRKKYGKGGDMLIFTNMIVQAVPGLTHNYSAMEVAPYMVQQKQ